MYFSKSNLCSTSSCCMRLAAAIPKRVQKRSLASKCSVAINSSKTYTFTSRGAAIVKQEFISGLLSEATTHKGSRTGFIKIKSNQNTLTKAFGNRNTTRCFSSISMAPTTLQASDVDFSVDWSDGPLVLGVSDLCFDAGSGDLKNEQLSRLDSKLGGALQQLCRENKFVGKSGTTCQARFFSGAGNGDQAMTSKAVALVGLGASCELANVTSWSRFGMQVASIALSANWPKTSVSVCGIERSLCSHSSIRAAFSSMLANSFVDDSFRSVTDAKTAGNFHAIGFGENAGPALVEAEKFARGIRSTMHLVNSPANRMTPSALAKVAIDLEEKYSDCMKAKILNREDCKAYGKHGMGLFLGVSQGSDEPPKFIHLTYTGEADPENPNREIAFIGKGVTFDSGGMNIKFGKDSLIDVMKFDMGGAAAVLGAAATIGDIKPRGVTVHFVIAACENMINGVALKPGDVITASDGTTVEVNNTDAEGRLTMADALLYVQNELPNCKEVIDIATLTGACIVALGDSVAGLITPSESMADKVQTAALTAGEDVWRLPLHKAYRKGLKSLVADMKNSGPRAGGTIIAALFLKDFVKDSNNLQWAHLDIAGPVWNNDRGATGFGVSTLVQYVLQN